MPTPPVDRDRDRRSFQSPGGGCGDLESMGIWGRAKQRNQPPSKQALDLYTSQRIFIRAGDHKSHSGQFSDHGSMFGENVNCTTPASILQTFIDRYIHLVWSPTKRQTCKFFRCNAFHGSSGIVPRRAGFCSPGGILIDGRDFDRPTEYDL